MRRPHRRPRLVTQGEPNRTCGVLRRVWIEEDGQLAADLAQHRQIRARDGKTMIHRLEQRNSEAFTERRKGKAVGQPPQPLELAIANRPDEANPVGDAELVRDLA